jgi:type I restriction-modification system DNA methylase subunit
MIIDPARLHSDKRYVYGLPLTGKNEISNANYLWMQMFASALSSKGRAGFVMANSASDAGNAQKEIRKKMVEQGFVDIVISVGTNMFLKVVTLDDIRTNDYSLNPGRYIEIIENEMDDVDFDTRMRELMAEFTTLTTDAHQLERKIIDDWKKIL